MARYIWERHIWELQEWGPHGGQRICKRCFKRSKLGWFVKLFDRYCDDA